MVLQSTVKNAGGGLFAARAIPLGTIIFDSYDGVVVRTSTCLKRDNSGREYCMRIGARIIDARDLQGRLVLHDGTLLDVHGISHAHWRGIRTDGISWSGTANLARFANQTDRWRTPLGLQHRANARFSKGKLIAAKDILPSEEILVNSYGKGYR